VTATRVNLTIGGVDADRARAAQRMNLQHAAAVKQLGPAKAYARWTLIDSHRRDLDLAEAFCCARDDNSGWQPSAEECFGAIVHERDYTQEAAVAYPKGKPCVVAYVYRYSTRWGPLNEYHPLNEEQRAARSATSKANAATRALNKEKAAMPLFADMIGAP
jgi:hypothetical protein